MTKDQKDHLDFLVKSWTELAREKYIKGAIEHGGNLWEKSALELLDEALLENIDQFVYLFTLRQKLITQEKVKNHQFKFPEELR